jgi:hypothetical protein
MTMESWYNYVTEQYEFIPTPSDFRVFIPQSVAAQGLYNCHLTLGKSPIQAAIEVLSICAGVDKKELCCPSCGMKLSAQDGYWYCTNNVCMQSPENWRGA